MKLHTICFCLAAMFFVLGIGAMVSAFFMPGHEITSLAEFNSGFWTRLTDFSTPSSQLIILAALLNAAAYVCFIAGRSPVQRAS